MSNFMMSLCWPLQMPPTAKAVLVSLAENADEQGYCWPSLTTISERTCFGRTAVIDAIKWLERHGALKADRSDRYRTTYVVMPRAFTSDNLDRHPNKSGRRTSSDGGGLVRLADNEVRETDDEVRQTDTNRQEPSGTVNKSNRQRAAKSAPTCVVTLPPWLPVDVWETWVRDRKERGQPLTQRAAELALATLAELRAQGFTPQQVIDNAIARGWRGLFAPTKPNTGVRNANVPSSSAGGIGDEVQRAIDNRQAREHAGRASGIYGAYTAASPG